MAQHFTYRPFTNFNEFEGFVCRIGEVDDFIHSRNKYVANGLIEAIKDSGYTPYGVYNNGSLLFVKILEMTRRLKLHFWL
jgi:hypothetical protein